MGILPHAIYKKDRDAMQKFVYTKFVVLQLEDSFAQLAVASRPALDRWTTAERDWRSTMLVIARIGLENGIGTFLELQRSVNLWLRRFSKEFYFLPKLLPDADLDSPAEQMIRTHFHSWYRGGLSFGFITQTLANELTQLELSLPSAAFNSRWPMLMSAHFIELFGIPTDGAVDDCDLCQQKINVQVKCPTCCDKVLCYNCFRKSAWFFQHDEERIFSELRSVWCPFCRSNLDSAVPSPIVQQSAPKRQRRVENDE